MTQFHTPDRPSRAASIEQAAAGWLIRVEADSSPEAARELETWLALDSRHRAAYLRLRIAWEGTAVLKRIAGAPAASDHPALRAFAGIDEQGRVSDVGLSEEAGISREAGRAHEAGTSSEGDLSSESALPSPRGHSREHRSRNGPNLTRENSFVPLPYAAAAAIGALVLVALWAWVRADNSRATTYATELGDFRVISLQDGSSATLNTNSELEVRYTADRRDAKLLHGEALFSVSHDSARPFVVHAAGRRLQAVGTIFSVRAAASKSLSTLVQAGHVVVEGVPRQLGAGDLLVISDTTSRSASPAITSLNEREMSERLEWVRGGIVFNATPLHEAVHELNRYNRLKIVIVDPEIANETIGGRFPATEPLVFVRALKRIFAIRVEEPATLDGKQPIRLYRGTRAAE